MISEAKALELVEEICRRLVDTLLQSHKLAASVVVASAFPVKTFQGSPNAQAHKIISLEDFCKQCNQLNVGRFSADEKQALIRVCGFAENKEALSVA